MWGDALHVSHASIPKMGIEDASFASELPQELSRMSFHRKRVLCGVLRLIRDTHVLSEAITTRHVLPPRPLMHSPNKSAAPTPRRQLQSVCIQFNPNFAIFFSSPLLHNNPSANCQSQTLTYHQRGHNKPVKPRHLHDLSRVCPHVMNADPSLIRML